MRALHLAAGLGLVFVTLLLVPASASHQGADCHAFTFGLVTPVTPTVCDTVVSCPAGGAACNFRVYTDTEGGGLVTVDTYVNGARVATCGPMLGACGHIATFEVAAGQSVPVRCTTGALTATFMAEIDCNPSLL